MQHPLELDVVQVVALAAEEAGVLLAQHPAEADRVARRTEREPARSSSCRHLLGDRLLGGRVLGGPADRPHDVLVAGAAADLAADGLADRRPRRDRGRGRAASGPPSSSPGVQNPHCRPCSFMNPCWTGSSFPPTSRPSTVRISRPSAIAASTVQLFTGSPSIHSTQAPQFDVSHPQWVPVRSRWSRRKCTRSSRGSTSREISSPFTVIVTFIVMLLRLGPGPPPDAAPARSARRRGGACTRRDRAGRCAARSRPRPARRRRRGSPRCGAWPRRAASASGAQKCAAPTAVRPIPTSATVSPLRTTKQPAAATAQSPARRSTFS